MPAPSGPIRNNLNTWVVPPWATPAVVRQMLEVLPPEEYDPAFLGQYHQTTYFDTDTQTLRRHRLPKKDYLTLRLRAYSPSASAGGQYPEPTFALSAKTESDKERIDVSPAVAKALLQKPTLDLLAQLLPATLFAKLLGFIDDDPLYPVVTVCCTRYATEDDNLRLTLDTNIRTDTGKCMPCSVLEYKAVKGIPPPPGSLPTPGLRPLKLSKFLWSTDWR